jgi:energy-coupling factor transporter ATP-binding protein EcfA2
LRHRVREWSRQREAATRALDRLAGVASVEARRAEFEELLADLRRREERAERAAVVCLVGSTGAGKSTLLNALAGAEIAREGVTRPTTVDPTVYLPDDADGRPFADLGCTLVTYDPHGPADRAAWAGQVFIDAPDWNSFAVEHRETAQRMVERSDVLIVVAHRQSVREKVAIDFLRPFTGKRRHMVFVLGRADELREEDRTALIEQMRGVARDELGFGDDETPTVFAVDARRARTEPERAHGFQELVRWLRGLADEAILEQIRRSGVLADRARLHELAGECRTETERALADLPGELERMLAAASLSVREDAARELDVRLVDLERQLSEEVGRQWRGPGGYALRAGGFSGGGLGLAMLVARRNPWTGAAAAGAGLAADVAGRWLRKHRLGRDLTTSAGHEEARSERSGRTARDLDIAMQDLQRTAGRAFVDDAVRDRLLGAETFDAGAHADALDETVATAWRDVLRVDVPARARAAMPAGLRLALDLPAYALLVHALGYHVLWGYLQGRPAGLDFVVNALLVAALWAIAVRWLAWLWLRRHARRIADSLRERIDAEASATIARAAAGLRRQVDRVLEELAELAGEDGGR